MGTHPIFESDFDCLTDFTRRIGVGQLSLKQWMHRQKVLSLYQRVLRAVIRIPDPKEKKYYFDWAASEFKKTKTLDPEDSYVLNIRMAEAVQWAEQFEKIYKRTDEGYEKDRTDPRNMTPK